MIYYIIIFLISTLHFFLSKRTYCITITIILVLFAGLRSNIIGPDTMQYEYAYNEINKYSFRFIFHERALKEQASEVGYFLIHYPFLLIGNYNVFKLFCSALAIIPASWIIYKYSKNAWVSFFVFFTIPVFTMMSMSMMRQGCAFGLALIAFHFCVKRRFLIFCLFIFIASLFHASVVVFFPVYFFPLLNYKKIFNLYFLGLAGFFYFFSLTIFNVVASFSRMDYNAGEGGGEKMLLFFLFLFLSSYLIQKGKMVVMENKVQLLLLAYTILLWTIGMQLNAVLRLAAYTEFFICIYISNTLFCIGNKKMRYAVVLITCIVCVAIMQTIVMKDLETASYYPYLFLWE